MIRKRVKFVAGDAKIVACEHDQQSGGFGNGKRRLVRQFTERTGHGETRHLPQNVDDLNDRQAECQVSGLIGAQKSVGEIQGDGVQDREVQDHAVTFVAERVFHDVADGMLGIFFLTVIFRASEPVFDGEQTDQVADGKHGYGNGREQETAEQVVFFFELIDDDADDKGHDHAGNQGDHFLVGLENAALLGIYVGVAPTVNRGGHEIVAKVGKQQARGYQDFDKGSRFDTEQQGDQIQEHKERLA